MNESQKIAECFTGIVDIQKYLVGMSMGQDSIGHRILESKSYADFKSGRSDLFTFDIAPSEIKTAIIGGGAVNDPLTFAHMPMIDGGVRRKLVVRDLLPVFPTQQAAIEFTRKSSATNSAAIQNRENTSLAESAYGFTQVFQPVETIGHFLPVSRQIMDDAGHLDAFIKAEMLHGLGEVEQNQLLNGSNTASQLNGMITAATVYTVQSPNLTAEADILRDAMRQIEAADFNPSAILLNPQDWYDIDVRKASTSDDTYTAGNPRAMTEPRLWGLPVVTTNSIASGTFLVGDFFRAGIIFDREQPQIEISRHDSTNFQENMLTVKATERLALVITNTLALVTGTL